MLGSQLCHSITSWFLGFLKESNLHDNSFDVTFIWKALPGAISLQHSEEDTISLSQLHRVDLSKHKETSVLHLQGLGKQDLR